MQLELTNNAEVLRENCGFEFDDDALALEFASKVHAELVSAGLDTINPRGNRGTYEQWTGAMWTWKFGPIGTFSDLADSEKETVENCVMAAYKKTIAAHPARGWYRVTCTAARSPVCNGPFGSKAESEKFNADHGIDRDVPNPPPVKIIDCYTREEADQIAESLVDEYFDV